MKRMSLPARRRMIAAAAVVVAAGVAVPSFLEFQALEERVTAVERVIQHCGEDRQLIVPNSSGVAR